MIINYSLNNPRSVVMITITLLLLGCVAIVSLPNEYLPEISTPQIIVNTIYPSATPKDIREKITIPLENALSSVKGLKNISSVSRNSISTIELNLKWGVNPIESELQIREAIDGVYMNLPQDSLKPRIIPYDPNSETLALIGVSSQTINLAKLTKISQDEIITKLQKIDGVGRVNIIGGRESELQILANQEKLSSMGLTPETVANIFKNTHIRYPSGSFIANNKEYMVIGNSNLTSINEVRNMNIPIENGTIKLSDVATVSLKDKTQISSFFFNGKEGIGLEIKKRKGVNQNIVINHLLKEIRELNVSYNGTLELYIIDNNYKKTSESVNTILESLILGSIISFLMLFIISGNIFSALLIIITIPTSLTITFLVMKLLNISINIMSLGGIAISIGMLLDNSVIVIDNINRTQNIPLGTREVSKSNLVSTITTLIVFTPLLLMPGIIGAIYKELAISISITLLSSYIISVSLLPT
ncbi:MAG: efflux RND transporter permease subunit, partial [Spirochaetales bacterium]|nr:efflux RND transporter permease subunit [Spirochaetales bacterium]